MASCSQCIYFGKDEDFPDKFVCTNKGTLYSHEEFYQGIMGYHCRLWDAFIPTTATEAEKEKAEKWQKMSYYEQPDYEEYFGL